MISQAIVLLIALQTLTLIMIALYNNHWVLRFIVLGYLTVMASASYFAFDGVKGWPAEEPTEIKGQLASVTIVNPSSKDKGGIYISVFLAEKGKWWEYDYPRLAPKTFYIEYSNNRAAKFEQAKQALQDGKEVRINGIPPKQAGKAEGEMADEDFSNSGTEIQDLIGKLISNNKDTYRPDAPNDLEIVEQGPPPPKGSNQ